MRFGLNVRRTLLRTASEYQSIDIVETELGATLLLGDAYMTSVADEFFYHEMLVHPALTVAPQIRRVLVIGGGDGGTVREVLRYREVQKVVMCELDGLVVEACKEHLKAFNVPWDDPRLELRIGDGVAFLRDYSGEPFDVILVDGPDPVGPAEGLFQSPFYQSCKARPCAAGRARLADRGAVPDARELRAHREDAAQRVRPRASVLRPRADLSERQLELDLRLGRDCAGRPARRPARADRTRLQVLQPRYPPRRLRPAQLRA